MQLPWCKCNRESWLILGLYGLHLDPWLDFLHLVSSPAVFCGRLTLRFSLAAFKKLSRISRVSCRVHRAFGEFFRRTSARLADGSWQSALDTDVPLPIPSGSTGIFLVHIFEKKKRAKKETSNWLPMCHVNSLSGVMSKVNYEFFHGSERLQERLGIKSDMMCTGSLIQPPTVDGRNPFRTTLKPWETPQGGTNTIETKLAMG